MKKKDVRHVIGASVAAGEVVDQKEAKSLPMFAEEDFVELVGQLKESGQAGQYSAERQAVHLFVNDIVLKYRAMHQNQKAKAIADTQPFLDALKEPKDSHLIALLQVGTMSVSAPPDLVQSTRKLCDYYNNSQKPKNVAALARGGVLGEHVLPPKAEQKGEAFYHASPASSSSSMSSAIVPSLSPSAPGGPVYGLALPRDGEPDPGPQEPQPEDLQAEGVENPYKGEESEEELEEELAPGEEPDSKASAPSPTVGFYGSSPPGGPPIGGPRGADPLVPEEGSQGGPEEPTLPKGGEPRVK